MTAGPQASPTGPGGATLENADWCDHRRLHSHCSDVPPVEFETIDYRSRGAD